MLVHPLVRGDVSLVQDYMLTKATLLLARDAPLSEWQFEAGFMRKQSGNHWPEPNGFLLGFTLARCICALEDSRSTPGPWGGDSTGPEEVVTSLVTAARNHDHVMARSVWTGTAGAGPGTTGWETVLALVSRLKRLAAEAPVDMGALVLPPHVDQTHLTPKG